MPGMTPSPSATLSPQYRFNQETLPTAVLMIAFVVPVNQAARP